MSNGSFQVIMIQPSAYQLTDVTYGPSESAVEKLQLYASELFPAWSFTNPAGTDTVYVVDDFSNAGANDTILPLLETVAFVHAAELPSLPVIEIEPVPGNTSSS